MPTCEQISNAYRLADVLDKVAVEWPEHFHMAQWVGYLRSPVEHVPAWDPMALLHFSGAHPTECGTSACALGWAPYALGEAKSEHEAWERYAERILGLSPRSSDEWAHLFGVDQDDVSGREGALAAAQRIRDWADQQECT